MPSRSSVCGEFTEARFPDYGQCWPRRQKRNCTEDWDSTTTATEPPGQPECDDEATIENTPELSPGYRVIATIFDENCEPILDENDLPILGTQV